MAHSSGATVGGLCQTEVVRAVAAGPAGPRATATGVEQLGRSLATGPGREDSLRHLRVLPRRAAVTAAWPEWVHPDVVSALGARGISTLWRHQAVAAEAARSRQHVVVSTGTASGKSLAYQLPALTAILERRGTRGERGASTLYISPTKALAQDQLASIAGLGLDVRVTTHDGDSSYDERDWTRDHGEYVLTNPDMLHRSLLPRHERWSGLFRSLDLVVVDECHHYRGVFGSHVAQVLRRLRRVCAHHGSDPTFVLASATVGNPSEHAGRLTGLDVMAVSHDDAPRGDVAVALWEPRFTSYAGENGAPVRRAASTESADLLADLVSEGVRTLAFVRSRRAAEQVAVDDGEPARRGRPGARRPGGGLSRWLPPGGAARDRAGAARRHTARARRNQRARARHRRLGARRRAGRGVPGHAGRVVAAGGSRRAQRRRRAGGADRPRRPARHLPRDAPGGAARRGGGADRLRSREPLRRRAAPLRRRPGGAAASRRRSTCSESTLAGSSTSSRRPAAFVVARRGGTGPIPSRPAPSPTSGRAVGGRSRSSRGRRVASSAP